MANSVSYARVRLNGAKQYLLRVLLETPQEELTDDETDIMFTLSFSPEKRKAILKAKRERVTLNDVGTHGFTMDDVGTLWPTEGEDR